MTTTTFAPPRFAPPSRRRAISRRPAPDSPDVSRSERRQRTTELLAEAADTPDELRRRRLHDEVVRLNMDVAESIATRFRNRGIPEDDLTQVAYLGLVKAVRRYDPATAHDFLSFAVPTIRGEVKRFFRDHGWTVRPPRRIQELQARIVSVDAALAQELGRRPRPREIAEALGEDTEHVAAALAANGCFSPVSLDVPVGDQTTTMGELLPTDDDGPNAVDARVILAPAVRHLAERDRRIIYLRFFEGRTQREIGDELGVTQMQVSRLLNRILRELRESLSTGDPA